MLSACDFVVPPCVVCQFCVQILVVISLPDMINALIEQTDRAGPASGSGQGSAVPAPAPGIVFEVWPRRAAGEDTGAGGGGRARGAAGQRRRRGGSDDEE
jgi:hypothetical protein